MKNRRNIWIIFSLVIVAGLIFTGMVFAQPTGRMGDQGGFGGQGGPGMRPGGMGSGPGAGQQMALRFITAGGPFADEEITYLMDQVKILGFINRFDFSAQQLDAIADLSYDARVIGAEMAESIREIAYDRLVERRDMLLAGEKPEGFDRQEKGNPPEGMKERGRDTFDNLSAIVDKFKELLTDEQLKMVKQAGRGGFDQGAQGGHHPGMQGGPGQDGGPGPGGRKGGGGMGGPGMGGNLEMALKLKVVEFLLDPVTIETIEAKLEYM